MIKNKNFLKNISFLLLIFVFTPNFSLLGAPIEKISEENSTKIRNDFLNKDNYLIGPGDQLNITFLDVEEFTGIYTVLSDGTIQLPLIGSIYVSEKTLDEATLFLVNNFKKELLRPDLFINVADPRPILVSVIGETSRPGIYSLDKDKDQYQYSGFPTVIDAIRKSGGFTQSANLKEVMLVRKINGKDGNFKKAKLNLLELMIKGDQSHNPYLMDGDIINLTKATSNESIDPSITKSNINPEFISVQVVGAVNNPGLKNLLPDTTLVQAVYFAGGPIEWRANKGNVELIRINNNGSASLGSYRLNLNQGVSNEKNPILNDGDIVKVNSNTISKVGKGLGVVTEPISGVVTVFSLFKLLN